MSIGNLIITRRVGEAFLIGDVKVEVVELGVNKGKFRIIADRSIPVDRAEVRRMKQDQPRLKAG